MGSTALLLGISLAVWVGPAVGHAMALPAAADPVPLPVSTNVRERELTGASIAAQSSSSLTAIDSSFNGMSPRNSRPWGLVFATETCSP